MQINRSVKHTVGYSMEKIKLNNGYLTIPITSRLWFGYFEVTRWCRLLIHHKIRILIIFSPLHSLIQYFSFLFQGNTDKRIFLACFSLTATSCVLMALLMLTACGREREKENLFLGLKATRSRRVFLCAEGNSEF